MDIAETMTQMSSNETEAGAQMGSNERSFGCNNNITECSTNATASSILHSDSGTYLERSLGFLAIGIIGIVANLFVILVLGSSVRIRRKLVNTLIIHQSFVDLLSSIALIGMAHLDGSDQHGLTGIHAGVYCFFVAPKWPLWVLMYTSSYSLMFLNVERYISIVFPFYHHTHVTRQKVLLLLPIVWILGIVEDSLIASTFVSTDGACNIGPSSYNVNMSWFILVAYIVLHFFLPVILVLFLYGHMILRLKEPVKSKDDATFNSMRDNVMEKAKKNIFKTMLLITICYTICYSFNCIYIALFLPGIIDILSGKSIRLFASLKENPSIFTRTTYSLLHHIARCKLLF